MSNYTDWRGTEITVGCHIVYPVRQSSSMWMNEAEVTEIVPTKLGVQQTESFFLRGRLVHSGDRYTDKVGARQRKVVAVTAVDRVTVV
jgi:hypothetical protein